MAPLWVQAKTYENCPAALNYEVLTLGGKKQNLCAYQGKVVLVTNIAIEGSFTRQLRALEDLYQTYKDKGFIILGFPTNDFGDQNEKSNEDIKKFCKRNYGISFPLFSLTSVDKKKGDNPFFMSLYKKIGIKPQWDFYKYYIDRKGVPGKSFDSSTSPRDPRVIKMLERLL